MKGITTTATNGTTAYNKEKLLMVPQKNTGTANTIKRMFNDFMIESRKDIFAQNQGAT